MNENVCRRFDSEPQGWSCGVVCQLNESKGSICTSSRTQNNKSIPSANDNWQQIQNNKEIEGDER